MSSNLFGRASNFICTQALTVLRETLFRTAVQVRIRKRAIQCWACLYARYAAGIVSPWRSDLSLHLCALLHCRESARPTPTAERLRPRQHEEVPGALPTRMRFLMLRCLRRCCARSRPARAASECPPITRVVDPELFACIVMYVVLRRLKGQERPSENNSTASRPGARSRTYDIAAYELSSS